MTSSADPTLKQQDTYERIAAAIAFLRQHHAEQPDLKAIAAHLHLSDYHVQRLFTQWVGISPKRFLQYLTVGYAKSTIQTTKTLLDLTLDAGLSSPGRLHDLFVKLEAMSPGEYKSGGRGLQIRYGIHETPFGYALIALTHRGICNLMFLEQADQGAAVQYLQTEWPAAGLMVDPAITQEVSDRIFTPLATHPTPLIAHVKGTNFQIQVWRSLLMIPPGGLATYGGMAKILGRPTAARAVGTAIGRNPVGYLIPCHRVIRESGDLGGYRWGLERKAALLGWEASRS
ncbi:MAG: methylated-DNA--[protein]-cysteine S-methyltransferase [Leptolyngbya sp. DLM2.Bin15]|nr:MAG: methylated-DNA--[protein]-cysteine S-methyltransferase [Leptolyngbya sp. DLM2.Bin15]